MSLIIIVLMLACYVGYIIYKAVEPHAPAVKDWDAFNLDTIGMDAKEIKKGRSVWQMVKHKGRYYISIVFLYVWGRF